MAPPHYGSPNADQVLALACTVVGVGPFGNTSMVARVAICNYRGNPLLDCYVAPTMEVSDYRTSTTGITPDNLASGASPRKPDAKPFDEVQRRVASMIKDKVIVGHSLWNDLSVLGIPHPAVNTRDVALYQPFRNALRSPNQLVRLPTLTFHLMGRRCQEGQQNPLENARAAVDLYRSHANEWETTIREGQWPSALPPSTFSRCYL
ncbi:ribonuclease H-like domain-containing protein [Russula earlei]|uniref:Ribonuclease H-like domain-containing protein n=1 Tax=Russula earlei TaxID=71964 RepID=A0ACC0UMK4_9AGAM|nr:ribonuclease H-like domain-containing protein [Russula earlei]